MNETIAKGLLILAVAAGIFAAGGAAMYVHDQKRYDALVAEHAAFRGGVETATRDFEQRKREYEAKGQSDKERADAKHTTELAAARDDVARMRVERDDERGRRFLAEKPAGSVCPDGQLCFNAAAFGESYRVLVKGLRGVADSCTTLEVSLKTAREWALGN